MNRKQINRSVVSAFIVLGGLIPTAFAATTSTDSTATSRVIAKDTGTAIHWMDKNAVTQMPDWTAVATYAATGAFADVAFPKSYVAGLKTSTDYARAILGVLANGEDPHAYQGVNLVAKLAGTQLTTGDNEGKFTDNIDKTGTDLINNQAWAIIALEDAGGVKYNRAAAAIWLINHQNKDGGFGYSSKYSQSDADDTAAAIVALRLLGFTKDSAPVAAALNYLKTQQAPDGGIVNGGTTGNSDSTGVTIDALASLGIEPQQWTSKQNGNPVTALFSFYDKSSGGFKYDNSGSEWSGVSGLSTRDGVLGLAAVSSKSSVYQRLEHRNLNYLNPYWEHVYESGGAWMNHKWFSWSQLRSMAVAGTYLGDLTPQWQQTVAAHGAFVTRNGKKTWVQWGPQLANQALADSFGLNTVHLNLIPLQK